MKNNNFFGSLSCALTGIGKAYSEERNLRFHIFAATNVIVFAVFYGLDTGGFAILFLTIAAVIAAELFNTAVERAVDTATDTYSAKAGFAKDAAAGGVLVTAAAAIAVAVLLFGDVQRLVLTVKSIISDFRIIMAWIVLELGNVIVMVNGRRK